MTAKEEVKKLRSLIKERIKSVSVRMDSGTAYGWVNITGSGECGEFSLYERQRLTELGFSYGVNFCAIAPEERKVWLCKLQNIPVPKEFLDDVKHERELYLSR